jgi:hypothetical protein
LLSLFSTILPSSSSSFSLAALLLLLPVVFSFSFFFFFFFFPELDHELNRNAAYRPAPPVKVVQQWAQLLASGLCVEADVVRHAGHHLAFLYAGPSGHTEPQAALTLLFVGDAQ